MYELMNLKTKEELDNYKSCITYEIKVMRANTRNELRKYDSNLLLSLDITTRNYTIRHCKKVMRDTDNQVIVYKKYIN
jgi:hypothetical protein